MAAVFAVAVFMMTGSSGGAAEPEPSATITMEHDSAGIGIGWHTGGGVLRLKDGSEYAVTMDAYSIAGLGFSSVTSTGRVFNLEKASDLTGEYTGTGKSTSFRKGEGKATLKNDVNNVRIEMVSKQSGVRAGIGIGTISFKLGKRLKGPSAPAPVAMAPVSKAPVPKLVKADPPPVVVPKPTAYEIQFGFDKSRVNLATDRVLDSILADWKDKGAEFRIVGHADMVGSAKYNMRLSQKRAVSIKQALIKKGVPASYITAVGVGQKQLAVPTQRGQRLRANRRVVMTVLPKK